VVLQPYKRGLPSHQQDLFQQKQKSSIDATTLQQETIMKEKCDIEVEIVRQNIIYCIQCGIEKLL
jgi:hypothetical protein